MKTYAMSDIHGCLDALVVRIVHLKTLGFFQDGCEDELVLLGDYVDRGTDSLGVVQKIMQVERTCPGRVVSLMGNHEDEFLRWLGQDEPDWDDEVLLDDEADALLDMLAPDFGPASGHAARDRLAMWRRIDSSGATMRSLLGVRRYANLKPALALNGPNPACTFERACKHIREDYPDLVRWMRELRMFYETDGQIFVHAGIDESRGPDWGIATPRDTLLNARKIRRGHFYKDVIAGHTATSSISGDRSFHGAFWDGASHYYIDGMTNRSDFIPVLVYDADACTYYELDEGGQPRKIKR